MCNGDGSTCLPGSRDSVTTNTSSTKKAFTPGAANLITSALDWLKRMGYDVDRRGQIAAPESTTKDAQKDDFYWAVVKTGCSVSCGGGNFIWGYGLFQFSRTVQPDYSRRNENCAFTKKYPARSVKS